MTAIVLDPQEVVPRRPEGAVQRTNLATNPKAGAGATTDWTNTSLATFAAVTLGAGGAPAASAALAALGITTGFHGIGDASADRGSIGVPVTSGLTYRYAVYVYLDTSSATGVQLRVDNAAGTSKGASTTLATLDTWTRLDASVVADATETWRLRVQQNGAGATDFYWTAVLIEQSATLGTYFDGDTVDTFTVDHRWTGTEEASTSQAVEYELSRAELDLNAAAIRVQKDGIDWGDAQIEQYLAQAQRGQVPVDFRFPNRTITIPLILGADGPTDFAAARSQLQAKVALIQREGGWLKRDTGRYADITNATLKFPDRYGHLGVESDVLLTLEAIPDFYGDEITLDAFAETAEAEIAQVLQQGGVDAVVDGDCPVRTRIVVNEDQGEPQFGLLFGIRSKHYSAEATAALAYEAEDLTPLDSATVVTVPSVPAGASGSSVVQHGSLLTGWTDVLSTEHVTEGHLTHTGTYRVWARAFSTSAVPPQVRFVYEVGDLDALPEENAPAHIPDDSAWYLLDLGEVRLDAAPVGAHRWEGEVQAKGAAGGENVSIDKLWFQPIDEGAGRLSGAVPGATILPVGRSAELRHDGIFRQTTDGIAYSPIVHVGDLPRLPPSGMESRPVELFIKASRGDLDEEPDSGIDDISVQVFYRPSWIFPQS